MHTFLMDNNKALNRTHKNPNPSLKNSGVKLIFISQISQKIHVLLLSWLMRYTNFVRFGGGQYGDNTAIWPFFRAFYIMRNALEEITTWHFMTIELVPGNFHYPILQRKNHRWKKKITECEANKSLADKKKSYYASVSHHHSRFAAGWT